MRISDLAARMALLALNQHDGTVPVEVPFQTYRAILRDHVELCDRVKELEARLAAALRRSAS